MKKSELKKTIKNQSKLLQDQHKKLLQKNEDIAILKRRLENRDGRIEELKAELSVFNTV